MHWTRKLKQENAELVGKVEKLQEEVETLKTDLETARAGKETTPTDWNPQVNKKYATQDGLSQDDFRYEQYTLSDLELVIPSERYPASIVLAYRCNIPADTPHANQYEQNDTGDWVQLPDPVGIALASVETQLISLKGEIVIQEDGRDHIDGQIEGSFSDKIWEKLDIEPGQSVKVKLSATPLFYYLNDEGGANMTYAATSDGYFKGKTLESKVYTISIDEDEQVSIT